MLEVVAKMSPPSMYNQIRRDPFIKRLGATAEKRRAHKKSLRCEEKHDKAYFCYQGKEVVEKVEKSCGMSLPTSPIHVIFVHTGGTGHNFLPLSRHALEMTLF